MHPRYAVIDLRPWCARVIRGLGVDIVEVDRVRRAVTRWGEPFLYRIFTPREIALGVSRAGAEHFAGRFAAKEAAMKALGTGHSRGVLWRDIEVIRRGGPPQLLLLGGAARRFEAIGGHSSQLTITHSDALALAQVILLGD